MSNVVSENVNEKVRFVQVELSSVMCPDVLESVWQVVGNDSDNSYGYVACSGSPRLSPSGKEYKTLPWAFVVAVDEFRSGVLFPYGSRSMAKDALLRSM